MKSFRAVLWMSVLVIAAAISTAQRAIRIAYMDMDYILEHVDEYKAAQDQLNQKTERWKKDIDARKLVIEQKQKDLSLERVLLTKELIEEREDEIRYLESELQQYQQDRFGPKGDFVIQQGILVQPIQDKVFNAVYELAKSKKYDFVFDKSADVVMIYANKSFDISEAILKIIKQGSKKSAASKKPNKVENKADSKASKEKNTENTEPDE